MPDRIASAICFKLWFLLYENSSSLSSCVVGTKFHQTASGPWRGYNWLLPRVPTKEAKSSFHIDMLLGKASPKELSIQRSDSFKLKSTLIWKMVLAINSLPSLLGNLFLYRSGKARTSVINGKRYRNERGKNSKSNFLGVVQPVSPNYYSPSSTLY